MSKKDKKKNKKLKLLWLILPAFIVAAVLSVAIYANVKNAAYVYDPYGTDNILAPGETGTLMINYNGADGMPENETVEYTAYEEVELPVVSKEGYHFLGWYGGGTCNGNTVVLNSKSPRRVNAWFEKDYTVVNAPAAIYTDTLTFTEFNEGEYPSVNLEAVDAYVDGGYKLYLYSEENFEGEETELVYRKNYKGAVGSLKVVKFETEGIEVEELTDDVRAELLNTFAPRMWWAEGEEYFATTVETAAENMSREMTDRGYIYMFPDLDGPDYMCDYLYGSLTDCKAYGFAMEKEFKYLDLSYFVFTPYDKSKVILGMQFGNHIGDWEHMSVRLMKYEESGKTYYRPIIVEFSTHSVRTFYSWDEVTITDGTHPVSYIALGSHGYWKDPGVHAYVDIKVARLTDECSEGTAWDLWKNDSLETYGYDSLNHTGWGVGGSEWNTCFDLDCYNENSNAVSSWGNRGWSPPVMIYPQLGGGPSGPPGKDVLSNYYVFSK